MITALLITIMALTAFTVVALLGTNYTTERNENIYALTFAVQAAAFIVSSTLLVVHLANGS